MNLFITIAISILIKACTHDVYSTFSPLIIIGFDSFPNIERKKKKSSVVVARWSVGSSPGVYTSHTFPTRVTAAVVCHDR